MAVSERNQHQGTVLQHIPSNSNPSPWSVDYTDEPLPTVVKLKSFIKQNLRNSNDSFTGSSDDNLSEVDGGGAGNKTLQSDERTTAEPKPLTTTNVTLHDRIWSKDLHSSPQHGDAKCIKLLESSSNEDLARDKEGDSSCYRTKQRKYLDNNSERSCDSLDRSCDSQDTMVLTITDNQCQTYAFHNRVITQEGATAADYHNADLYEIPQEVPADYIPIRREPAATANFDCLPDVTRSEITSHTRFQANPGAYTAKPFGSSSNLVTAPRKAKKKKVPTATLR